MARFIVGDDLRSIIFGESGFDRDLRIIRNRLPRGAATPAGFNARSWMMMFDDWDRSSGLSIANFSFPSDKIETS
jgi:hypothetical protein